jgi:hypothetical protein
MVRARTKPDFTEPRAYPAGGRQIHKSRGSGGTNGDDVA